jgi:hypothetical protein
MPGFNRTGPQGFGAGTGRGLGPCGGGVRRGSGRGFGRRGFNGMGRNIHPQDEQKILEEELKALENEKRAISERIEDLKKN